MADNVAITAGSGTTVRTDELAGGVQVQVVKIALGADGAEDNLVDSGQQAMAASVPVAIASNQSAIPVTDNSGSLTVDGSVSIGAAIPAGTNNIGDVDVLTIAAGETHIGEVGGNTILAAFTLSLDTSVYAAGDVLADTQAIASVFRANDRPGVLQSITLNDKDDQGQALDLVFLSANNSIGTENAAVSVTDANADAIMGIIPVAAADFIDLGGCRVASLQNIGLPIKPASGTTTLYIAAISRGTGTYTASGITGILGILRD